MGRKKRNSNGRRGASATTEPVRDIQRGSEVQFETVVDMWIDGFERTRHVATAGLVQGTMSGTYAWELGLVSKKRSGTVLKILIPPHTPMVDLRTGERHNGLPVPFLVYKHKSRVREVK